MQFYQSRTERSVVNDIFIKASYAAELEKIDFTYVIQCIILYYILFIIFIFESI